MAISDYMAVFAGKPIVDWKAATGIQAPDQKFFRIGLAYADGEKAKWTDKFNEFLDAPNSNEVTGIVVGVWDNKIGTQEGSIEAAVQALVAARDRLPKLSALFFGDITYEECEISWIEQGDVSPLLKAYPNLEHFGVRGGNGLKVGTLRHEHLKTLIIETGGLNVSVVKAVTAAQLPSLEHLELWLGTDEYGATTKVKDLAPLLEGKLFPRLKYLGLRDSDIVDEIALVIAQAPILERLEVLDLSLGTLTDTGAAALVASPALAKLQKLDLHHHFCSEAMVEQLEQLPLEVDVSEAQEADEDDDRVYRFVAVGE